MKNIHTNKTLIKNSLLLAAAAGTIWINIAHAQDAMTVAGLNQSTQVSGDHMNTNPEIRKLSTYGSRFSLAVKAIEEASETPNWGWDDCCDDDQKLAASNN